MIKIRFIYIFNSIEKKTYLGLFLFLSCYFINAQIQGTASNNKKEPVAFATIILKTAQDSTIVAYTQTDKEGFYELRAKSTGKYLLSFSSLSYAIKIISLTIEDVNKPITQNVVLDEQQLELNEIILNADLPIRIKKDTIIIDAKAFRQGNEEVVEDLLKKIPGLTVESDGTIKVNNQEVEKIMIEGDDFFERGYKILTKNMPASPLNKIEILQNYSNNRLLKGVEESDKVALNLTLDEDAKRQWFGNIELGHDVELDSFYQGRFNLMSFGKKNKFYFLGLSNSVGVDVSEDTKYLINSDSYQEPRSLATRPQVLPLMNIQGGIGNFERSRSNFNNAELLSLNAIFNPTEKLKIKTLGYLNWDEKNFFRNSRYSFFANDTDFTNTEDFKLRNIYQTTFGKLQLNYDISKTQSLESITSYGDIGNDARSNLLFNSLSTRESLETAQKRFNHNTTYTHRIDSAKVILLTARVVNEKVPQEYDVNQYLFQDLFSTTSSPDAVNQVMDNQMTYAGLQAHFLDRKKSGNLFEIQLGNDYQLDELSNELRFSESGTTVLSPTGYQNNTRYGVNDLYLNSSYLYKMEDWKITGKVALHQLWNSLEQSGIQSEQQQFFINPSLNVNYEINRKNRLSLNLAQNRTNAQVLDVYDQFVLTGFRSFSKGTGTFNQLDASTASFNYQLGNWSDKFFATFSSMYSKNHDFFSSNTTIQPNYSQSQRIVIQDRESIFLNATADYYFNPISSNLKLKASHFISEFKNIINNSQLREVQSVNSGLGLEMRSAFEGVFNYHLGTNWSFNKVTASGISNSFVDNTYFMDLSFVFTERFNISLRSEGYFFGNINDGDNTYYFLDMDARYKLKDKSPFSFAITARNLTNTEQFRTSSINDVSSSTVSYRLLPRYTLLSVKYRF